MPHGTTESLTLSGGTAPASAPAAPQLFEAFINHRRGDTEMPFDVTFEDEPETITGTTPVPGLSMSDVPVPKPAPKPAAPAASAPKAGEPKAAPASGDGGPKGLMGTVKSAEDAQR